MSEAVMPTERNNRQSSEISDATLLEIARKHDFLNMNLNCKELARVMDALRETRRETLLEVREEFLDARTAKEFGDWLERKAKEGM